MAVPTNLLMLATLWGPVTAARDFCVEQPESLLVRAGGSVIIPCTYSYPRNLDHVKVVEVYWRSGKGDTCGASPFIFNRSQSNNYTDKRYQGRLTLVGDVLDSRSGAIRIDHLTHSDADEKYCCRIVLPGKKEMWQNRHMTQLVFADRPTPRVIQLDAIPARAGASVTIPCGFTDLGVQNVDVIWRAGLEDLCSNFISIYNTTNNYIHNYYKGRVTLVTDPRGNGTSSLHIINLMVSDSRRYCCTVGDKNRGVSSTYGTELIVGDLKPIEGFTVTQPKVIKAEQDSLTMNCNYTYPQDKFPLWIGVYWAVGDEWDKIIRYPSPESINLGYGRKNPELSTTVSLLANEVTDIGNKSVYCLVVFRFCRDNNGFTSVIQQGAGTKLIMEGTGLTNIIIVIAAACAILLIVIVIFLFLKKKGLICKGSKAGEKPAASEAGLHLETPTDRSKHSQNAVNSDVSQVNNAQKVEVDLLYAALNLEKDANKKSRAQPSPENETVYSAVRMK